MAEDSPQTPTTLDQDNYTASASLKLPTFSALDAPTWFKRVEVQFRINRIRDSRKSDHVLAALPEEVFSQIASILDTDDDIPYEDLKVFLLEKFTPSAASRASKIRALSLQPLGEQKPSAAWTEIFALAQLSPAVDMLKEMWLCRLPSHIRAALPKASETPTSELAAQADALMDAHAAASNHRIFQAEENAGVTQDVAAIHRFPQKTFYKPRPPVKDVVNQNPERTYDKRQTPLVCFYHRRFGIHAKKCEKGCTWPKNM